MGRRWDALLESAKQVETLSKPVAIVLAVIGLVSVDFPGLTRTWQRWTAPEAWYQVGTIRRSDHGGPVWFAQASYDSAVWNGTFRPAALLALSGQEIVTTDTAVGRHLPGNREQIDTVLDKRVCLHVVDLAFADYVPPDGLQTKVTYLRDLPADPNERMRFVQHVGDINGSPGCQPYTRAETGPSSGKRVKESLDGLPPALVRVVSICPRTLVWVQAKKVSC